MKDHVRLFFLTSAILWAACSGTAGVCAGRDVIVAVDQRDRSVVMMDSGVGAAKEFIWKWTPDYDPNIREQDRINFKDVSDCKVRDGGRTVLVCASYGGFAAIDVATKRAKLQGCATRRGGGPHAVERLPDGRIAIANSVGVDALEIFDVSAAPLIPEEQRRVFSYEVVGAHGVVWDDKRSSLFVLGHTNLYEFAYSHESGRVEPKKILDIMPCCGDEFGHDLVPDGKGGYFLSNDTAVWNLDPDCGAFRQVWSDRYVKGFDRSSEGDLLTIPRERWWTDRLVVRKDGHERTVGPFPGSRFYKARWYCFHPDAVVPSNALASPKRNVGGSSGFDRPETWFHVIGGNASKEGIAADIAAIAEAGIGGIQFFHGGWDVDRPWPGVTNMIPCLSEKWQDLVKFAETECHRRGLTFKMQNCPGWSMSGGPWITPDKAMRRLVAFEPGRRPAFDADDDYHEIGSVTFDEEYVPGNLAMSVVVTASPVLNQSWCYEPDIVYVVKDGEKAIREAHAPKGCWYDTWDGCKEMTLALDRAYPKERLSVELRSARRIDRSKWRYSFLSGRRLDNWEAKAGRSLRDLSMSADQTPIASPCRRTLVFGHVNAKKINSPAPKEGRGWECDKLDPAGFEANWEGYLGRLVKAGVKIDGTLVDSWECGSQNWTWRMEEYWRRYNDYELRPWLPALFGHVLGSEAETEKFLLDWRNTLSRLVEENYYGTIARLAHENGMSVQYETAFGDVIQGDLLRFWKHADEPMCEFFGPFDERGADVGSFDFKPSLPCVSAAHVYGKRRVSCESLTSFKLTFDENFREWKQNIDRHFGRGVTHVVFHTYTHNPVVGGRPPSTSFANSIGSPFLRLQTWWPYMKDFTDYLAFCGRELERGRPGVDILMYLGDAVGHRPTERTLLFGNRYKYDYLNFDVLSTRLSVRDGRLVLPDGMSYRVLWVPEGAYLSAATERRLAALEHSGARIVRGDFTPDWESPIAWYGKKAPDAWYERIDGETNVFFTAEFEGDNSQSLFTYFVDGRRARTVDPVSGRSETDAPSVASREIPIIGWSRPLGAWKDVGATDEERAFSGTREYSASFELDENLENGMLWLDLGEVRDWATVRVNGQEVARLWCAPYRCDVSRFVKPGRNELSISVTSTWYNRLIFDADLPESKRKTWTIKGPAAGSPFHDSGFIGPVNLSQAVRLTSTIPKTGFRSGFRQER